MRLKVIVQKQKEKPLVLHGENPHRFSIGTGMHCSYTIDNPMLAKKHRLIRRTSGRNFLMVPEGVACELASRKSEKMTLETLISLGIVEKRDHSFAVPFKPGTAAVLHFGDTVLGVEYVGVEKKERRDALPFSLRMPPLSKNDLIFISIMAISLLLNFSSVWLISRMKFESQAKLEDLDKRYAKLILEAPVVTKDLFAPKPIETKPKEETPPETETPEVKPKETKAKKEAPAKSQEAGESQALARARSSGLLAHLDKPGGSNVLQSSSLRNVMQGVGVLTTKRPSGQSISGPALGYRESSGIDNLVAGISLRSGVGGSGEGGNKKTAAVSNPFDVTGSGAGHALRSYEEIDRVIRRYLPGLRILYERFLRSKPTLAGRVTLKFIISSSGEVSDCKVQSSSMDDREFEQELVKRISLWKFPAIDPKNGAVQVVYPFTFLPKTSG